MKLDGRLKRQYFKKNVMREKIKFELVLKFIFILFIVVCACAALYPIFNN